MEFVTKQIAPLLPSSPFEQIIKFRYIAWGNAHWNSTQVGDPQPRSALHSGARCPRPVHRARYGGQQECSAQLAAPL